MNDLLNSTLTPEEKWERATLANNFLFCKIMESEPEICKHVIEILLGIEIDRIEVPQSERTMQEILRVEERALRRVRQGFRPDF